MAEINGMTFDGTRVMVDGNQYRHCVFNNCVMVFTASGPCGFSDCRFIGGSWAFEGAAQLTLSFMGAMYVVNPQMIEATFDNIRSAAQPPAGGGSN